MSWLFPTRSTWLHYACALLVTALALLLRWMLDPWLGDQVPFITLFGAVAVVSWLLGTGPAVLSVLAGLGGSHLLMPDAGNSLRLGLLPALVLHLLYLLGCALIMVIAAQARRRRREASRATRQLSDNESRLQQILDALPVLVAYVDRDLHYRFNNAAYTQMFGLRPEQLAGKHVRELVGAEAFARIRAPLQAVLRGEPQQLRTELDYQGIGRRQMSIKMVPHWSEGQVDGYFAVIEDISDRLQGELERAHLAAIFESADDAVISKRLDGTVISWNAGAERLFGWTAAEMVGQRIDRIIPPDLLDEERHILSQLRQGLRLKHFETERLRRDGRRIPLSMTVSPIRGESGQVVGASHISRDISERKTAEAQMAAADRRKDEFLAMLAHELRNPLAPILNAAQFMDQHGGLPAALQPARAIIERQASHMRRLVDDLLDLSRINRGQITLKTHDLDLVPLLAAVVEAWQSQVHAAGLELAWQAPAVAVWVHADETRLSQVFGNLLSNAIKYTPRGGRINVRLTADADRCAVRICDTGIGLAADQLELVFEMFAQVDTSLERSQSGLGIGLTLARQLIVLHRGTLTAHSDGAGQGTCLLTQLPTVAQPLPAALDSAPASQLPARPLRLLLAEDNPDVAHSLIMMLELAGYTVLHASDGHAALELVTGSHPDVALLDIGMPLLNGYEVAQRIRALPGGERIRLLALTGWGQDEDRRRASEAGFDAHCTKPVDFTMLRALIDLGPRKAGQSPSESSPPPPAQRTGAEITRD